MLCLGLPNNAQLELVEVEVTPSNSNSSNSNVVGDSKNYTRQ
jgi:hypothetical protein